MIVKKPISVKLVISIFISIIIFLLFLSACQPTPEELVVKNKDKDELIESIQASATPETTSETKRENNDFQEIEKDNNITETKAVEHWNYNTEIGKDRGELNIDADIIVPANSQLPIVSIEPKSFTQEELSEVIYALVGDRKLYEYVFGMTKNDIEDQIIKTKLQMKDLNSDMACNAGAETLEELEDIGNQEAYFNAAICTSKY